jgi:hypothetical protein
MRISEPTEGETQELKIELIEKTSGEVRETSVYFWNGSSFHQIPLPDDLPAPEIKFRKGASSAVKNYGGAVKPLRWLKSGALELSTDSMMMSRDDGATYTGLLVFTLGFDSQNHAFVEKVGKTKTTVDE